MEEYVKLSLDKYEYFRELEQNKRLNTLAEAMYPVIQNSVRASTNNGPFERLLIVNQAELKELLEEAFASRIRWSDE
ncbi:hypothetical protein ACRW9N_13255 [Listeria aquatica]|uniref:hypothetical protein n=1 Tax=Listeria aquatica TaxID=1494960 RepID=UPI003EF45237